MSITTEDIEQKREIVKELKEKIASQKATRTELQDASDRAIESKKLDDEIARLNVALVEEESITLNATQVASEVIASALASNDVALATSEASTESPEVKVETNAPEVKVESDTESKVDEVGVPELIASVPASVPVPPAPRASKNDSSKSSNTGKEN